MKNNQIRCLAKRGAKVTVVPWNYDFNKLGVYDINLNMMVCCQLGACTQFSVSTKTCDPC